MYHHIVTHAPGSELAFEAMQAANSMKVLLMMYDGSISYLNKAVDCSEKGDLPNRNLNIAKARDIIEEFNNSLDLENGGEIAKSLKSLYFFMDRHLSKAAWGDDIRAIQDVISMLSNLRDSWHFASDSLGKKEAVRILS
jgi:flagellar protein FliS